MKNPVYCLLMVISALTLSLAESPALVTKKINIQRQNINRAANMFGIDTLILPAIIYAERTLNVDWMDDALDVPTAYKGYNSSIGFCQVKMKTAYWIEVQLSDSTSKFFPGKQFRHLLPVSKSPRAIIKKLINDSLNIQYAAAYIKIIQSYWQKAGHPIADRPDIVGTLYSTGMYLPTGKIRNPNATPKSNAFGKKTLEAYKMYAHRLRE